MIKEKGEIFIFFVESLNRRKLRVSESRSNVYIDYAEAQKKYSSARIEILPIKGSIEVLVANL